MRGNTPPPDVSIVIPAYRSPKLAQCLASLENIRDDGVPFDVRVVLNDATSEVREIAEAHRSDVIHLIDMPMNLGVSGGLNAGYATSNAPYFLGLQDDATVEPGWLRHLMDRIQTAPDIGAVGGLTLDTLGRVWDAGWIVWCDGITSPVWMNGSRDPDDYTESRAIAQHGSAGLLVRREAWESIGGFDDAFYPAYYGDVDICLSLRSRDWRLVYEPRSRMCHSIESTSTPPYQQFLLDRNRQKLLVKHGAFIADMPAHSNDQASIAAMAERVAATPVGARPAAPTSEELELLRSRLARTAELVFRWERDLLRDYASHLEARWSETEQRISDMENALAETQAREGSAIADAQREAQQCAALHEELTVMRTSRSWRFTAILRAVKQKLTRALR